MVRDRMLCFTDDVVLAGAGGSTLSEVEGVARDHKGILAIEILFRDLQLTKGRHNE